MDLSQLVLHGVQYMKYIAGQVASVFNTCFHRCHQLIHLNLALFHPCHQCRKHYSDSVCTPILILFFYFCLLFFSSFFSFLFFLLAML